MMIRILELVTLLYPSLRQRASTAGRQRLVCDSRRGAGSERRFVQSWRQGDYPLSRGN
jgi:hypothetical protein